MERIELRAKTGRLILLTGGALAFVAVGAFLVYSPAISSLYPPLFVRAIGVACILFFGACFVAGISQFFNRSPRIVLSDDGLFAASLRTPLIAWSDILDARIVTIRRSKFITLNLIDEHTRIAALPPYRRRVAQANLGLGFGAFNLSTTTLGISADTLLAEIHQRIAAFGSPLARR